MIANALAAYAVATVCAFRTAATHLAQLIISSASAKRGAYGRKGMRALDPRRAELAQALVVEHAITENLPDGSLWPPPEGDGWFLVCRRPTEQTSVWRRLHLKT
jgi:hypothetical protein